MVQTIDYSYYTCQECNSPLLNGSRGELTCHTCGLVNHSNELQTDLLPYHYENKISIFNRTHPFKLPPPIHISHNILHKYKWRRLDQVNRQDLRKEQTVYSHLLHIKSILQLDGTYYDMVQYLILKCIKQSFMGRSIRIIIIAIAYIVGRILNLPIFINNYCDTFNLKPKRILHYISFIIKLLDLTIPNMDYKPYIYYVINKLHLDMSNYSKVYNLFLKIPQVILSGLKPIGVIGSLVYMVCGERISQKKISKVLDVSDLTIRNNVKRLEPYI